MAESKTFSNSLSKAGSFFSNLSGKLRVSGAKEASEQVEPASERTVCVPVANLSEEVPALSQEYATLLVSAFECGSKVAAVEEAIDVALNRCDEFSLLVSTIRKDRASMTTTVVPALLARCDKLESTFMLVEGLEYLVSRIDMQLQQLEQRTAALEIQPYNTWSRLPMSFVNAFTQPANRPASSKPVTTPPPSESSSASFSPAMYLQRLQAKVQSGSRGSWLPSAAVLPSLLPLDSPPDAQSSAPGPSSAPKGVDAWSILKQAFVWNGPDSDSDSDEAPPTAAPPAKAADRIPTPTPTPTQATVADQASAASEEGNPGAEKGEEDDGPAA